MHDKNQSNNRYKPRSGKIGKSFHHYSNCQMKDVHKITKDMLVQLGYEIPPEQLEQHGREQDGAQPSTNPQFFPSNLKCPIRCVRKGKPGSDKGYIRMNLDFLLRHPRDPFGRNFCYIRRRQQDPIIAADGTELNAEEAANTREIMGVINGIIEKVENDEGLSTAPLAVDPPLPGL
jgi:hypothetical protein